MASAIQPAHTTSVPIQSVTCEYVKKDMYIQNTYLTNKIAVTIIKAFVINFFIRGEMNVK